MTDVLDLLRDTVKAFGDYLCAHRNARGFPDQLIAEHKQKYHAFWTSHFTDQMSIWKEPCLKGVFVGTIVGRDLALYVRRFDDTFDRLLLREPLSKLFFIAPYKTQTGVFEEMVAYLNVIIEIERWIEEGIVCLYPPFYLMPGEIRQRILDIFVDCYSDDRYRELALTCPDRKLSKEAMLRRYNGIFERVFTTQYVDYCGGIGFFTKDYIIRTVAQDIATAVVLASEVDAIVVSSLDRTTRLLKWGHSGLERKPMRLTLPTSLEHNDVTTNRREGGWYEFRRLLVEYTRHDEKCHIGTDSAEQKTVQQKMGGTEEIAFLHKFVFLKDNLSIGYLKVPFKTAATY